MPPLHPFERRRDRLGKTAARRPRRAPRRGCRPWDAQPLEPRQLLSSTYTVISTADDGSGGTLRWAIGQVNADPAPDADTINFAIAGSAPFTIAPTSALPTISHAVIIDGTTQAGYAVGAPVVELNGSGAGYADGLTLSASNSTIEGLVIDHFTGAGLVLSGTSNSLIQGNFIGIDPSGATAAGNSTGILFGYGSTDANVTIGGTTAGARNVLSGNFGTGIILNYSAVPGLAIQGNLIGTDATGTKPLGNANHGIDLSEQSGSILISGDVISANGADGLNVSYMPSASTIQDNLIGTDITGTQPLGNSYQGVYVGYYAPGLAVTDNVISANAQGGVYLYGFGVTLQGNRVGTDITGTQPLGNQDFGVESQGYNNLIGDPTGAAGNIIAFNQGPGVLVFSSGNAILGNSIFGNTGQGIVLGSYGNNSQPAPALTGAVDFGSSTAIVGTLTSGPGTTFTVQFFASPVADPSGYGEGQTYLGSTTVTTDFNGSASFQANLPVAVPAGQVISATATDPYNNTSAFSNDATVAAATPPVGAGDDAYNTDVNTTLSVSAPGVLANDISLDQGAFTASLVADAAHGHVVLNPDGSFTYSPASGYSGPDAFTYSDIEGAATSNVATVSISVNAKTQVVTNTNDGGPGSLREAMRIANLSNTPDPDTIAFAIPGTGPFTIAPATPLPTITHALIIDGATQAGYAAGAPVIVLDGSAAGSTAGLTIHAGDSTIEGLVIDHFIWGPGIFLNGASDVVIQGNLIGTDPTGSIAAPNAVGIQIGDFSSFTYNSDITIGGATAASRNVISGNSATGVLVPYGVIAEGLTIQGNYIGTDASGTKPLGNGLDGILDGGYDLSEPLRILGNVISANGSNGIEEASYGPSPETIQGNFIGTDVTGTQPLGNASSGVFANYATPILLTGNVISANGNTGVTVYAYGSALQGNKVGTDVTGTLPLGNRSNGIDIEASNILVGDAAGANGNVIADNGGAGVFVGGSTGVGILGNSIFGNAGLGIVLGYNGNNQQAAPLLTQAVDFGSVTVIAGTFTGAPSTTFTIQVFSNPAADPSGYGQGQTYLGSTSATTDASGNGTFRVSIPVGIPAGQVISATATDPNNDTSAFSRDLAVIAANPPVAAFNDAYNTDIKTTLTVAAPGVLANDLSVDNGVVTAALAKGPAHGTVLLKPDGSFTYTPKGNYVGPDSFTYVAVEGKSSSNVATVSISVNAKTQVVTNTNDSGPGSLRQALLIADVSNTPDPDTIAFAIPGTGPFLIQPSTPLPAITHPTVIDGYTQKGASPNTLAVGDNAVILIQIDGSLLGFGTEALAIPAGGSTVKGLSITAFSNPIDLNGSGNSAIAGNFLGLTPGGSSAWNYGAVVVSGAGGNTIGGTKPDARNVIVSAGSYAILINGPNNTIQGDYIETDLTGTRALGYATGIQVLGAANTTIGGTKAGAGNVVSGSIIVGGLYSDPGTTGTLIQGNFLGVDATGSVALGSQTGIVVYSGSGTVIGGTKAGARNVIRNIQFYNFSTGISGVAIQGNFIGTDATGTKPLSVYADGIDLYGATGVTIGGTAKGAGNVISGNYGYGIYDYNYNPAPTGNVIQGNFIGTDATGAIALPNGNGGIYISANGDLVGGTTDRAANVISGNGGNGVAIFGSYGSTGQKILVQGNFIGTDATGTKPLGNAGDGVAMLYGASNNTIGGTAVGAGNVIADNGGNGVSLDAFPYPPDINDAILSNAIYGNAKLGIDLGNDGVTPNTPGGPHFGPNQLQNTPVLLVGAAHGNQTAVKGTLNAAPGTTFLVQFFSSPAGDPSGHGEGQSYLGSITVVTDATGNALFQAQFKNQPGTVVTATATDPNGNTSEFSADVPLVASQATLLAQNDAYRVDSGGVLTVAAPGVQTNDISFGDKPVVSSVTVGPAHGKLTLASDGSFVYTPTPGYVGTDSFTYKDTGSGPAASATVTITVAPTTFVVTNTNDSGPGSLRQAILDADQATRVQPDTIVFAIPGSGPFVIQPATPLPAVTHPTVIDGYSQAGSKTNTLALGDNAVILIRIDGSNLPGFQDGLLISAGGSTIDGLDISGFGNNIHLTGGGGDVIRGNFIGTDATGLAAGPNNFTGLFDENSVNPTIGGSDPSARNVISGNGACGILLVGTAGISFGATIQGNYIGVDATGLARLGNAFQGIALFGASDCLIGGTSAGQGNVVSGNDNCGIVIGSDGSTGDVIQGNLIGTDATGTTGLGNAFQGIYVGNWYYDGTHYGSASKATIGGTALGAGNLISDNGDRGVWIAGLGANDDVVQGNRIGTDITGTFAIGNHWDGVNLSDGAAFNTVGGTTPGSGNLLSGNLSGASIYGGTSGNTIEGNLIGTDATGTKAIANIIFGIYISGSNNTIGGTAAGTGNVISGNNSDGIYVENASGVAIQGNLIGTDAAGTSALGNQGAGVRVLNSASNNTIGGTDAGAGNAIAFNAGSGVAVGSSPSDPSAGNAILSNAIFANGGLGIDLGNDGVTLNTPGTHSGTPNQLQSFPVLTSATGTPTDTTIAGALNSTPFTTFTIQFFSNPTADPSGYGQGQTYLGSTTVTTDVNGDVSFSWTVPVAIPAGQVISATATDPSGNTSEFSADLAVTSGMAASTFRVATSIAAVDSALTAPLGPVAAGLRETGPGNTRGWSVAGPRVAAGTVTAVPQGPLGRTGLAPQGGPKRTRPAGSLTDIGGGSWH
jgi:hypothetical protein